MILASGRSLSAVPLHDIRLLRSTACTGICSPSCPAVSCWQLQALPQDHSRPIQQRSFFAQVGQHMMGLIERNYMLQFPFHDAEQHFLDWYFKFTRSACGS